MEQQLQTELLNELLELHNNKSPFLDEHWEKPDLERYTCPQRFAREQERIFRSRPHIAAHASELPEPGSFLTMESAGRPLLLVRGEDGVARAFYNVCRHRGAQLVGQESGCQYRFSCPYHAWTWNNAGDLIAVPHEKTGFPGLDRSEFGLHSVQCEEFAGWIWIALGEDQPTVEEYLGDMTSDILAMAAADHAVFDSDVLDIKANWKILVEGGIEAYHFRVAHKNTIAPLFLDNLSSYRQLGACHMRSVLPRSTLTELGEENKSHWDIAKHANVLYTLFPGSQFLVQEDHFVWIQAQALAPDLTRLRLATMVPNKDMIADKMSYWRKHHTLTRVALDEDFVLGEGIQKGMGSGANPHLNFGRFEGALTQFNQTVDAAIA